MRRSTFLYFVLTFLMFTSQAFAKVEKYTFDPSHTSILFKIDHLGFAKFIGEIMKYDGHILFDREHPAKSSVEIVMHMDSIDTDVPELDKKLLGPTYFNTAKYPSATFKSTKIEVTGDNTANITGDLFLLGKTKPVTLTVVFNKSQQVPFGSQPYKAGFSATGKLYRSAFGMTELLPAIGDEVFLEIELEAERVEVIE